MAQDQLANRRIQVPELQSSPALVHFVSFGHWTRWRDGVTTNHVLDVFRKLYPEENLRESLSFLIPFNRF